MGQDSIPGLDEVTLGAFLEDIGKFMQRAHRRGTALHPEVMNRASIVLPGFRGRSSHWHALWTDEFFEQLEAAGASFPGGVNLVRVRDAAVYHHRPATPLHWLSAEADRLSAGMDRKPKDESAEEAEIPAGGDAFRRTALRSVFAAVSLDGTDAGSITAEHLVTELSAGRMAPGRVGGEEQQQAYAALWPEFFKTFVGLCNGAGNLDLFHEAVLSLSERFTWAIPSSTLDQPDVSLHDHNRSVAAIAACLYLHHQERGELGNEAAIRDRRRPKFRFLVGDLSGIQASLFRLASQQVKGVARILRARSFLMSAAVEAAALLCRRSIGVPPYCLLQSAGGRFLLLVPDLAGLERAIGEMRGEIDRWMVDRYFGDLAINLALGPAISGAALMRERVPEAMAELDRAVAQAKQRSFAAISTGVLRSDYGTGECRACGVRPAAVGDGEVVRCRACDDEHAIGRRLPGVSSVLWSTRSLPAAVVGAGHSVAMPGGLWLSVLDEDPDPADRAAWNHVVSGYSVARVDCRSALPRRHLANYVPSLQEGEEQDPRFAGLSEEAREIRPGEVKTFEHLAALSREIVSAETILGRPMLAVLKADMDRLGQIFSRGLKGDRSLGRLASLSRMTDAFFTIELPELLRRDFPNVYTVYAGGDDLLLLGPWRDILSLAVRLEAAFRAHVAGNPQITLSAGIEFCSVNEPLNRSVRRAEERLESAKDSGRNRVSAVTAKACKWEELVHGLHCAEEIKKLMRNDGVSTGFLYRALHFARERQRAEQTRDSRFANWRARWGYHLARAFPGDEQRQYFDALLSSGLFPQDGGPRADAGLVLTIAIYRNR